METARYPSNRSSHFLGNVLRLVNFVVFLTGICYSWTSPFLPKFKSNDSSINPVSRPVTTSEEGLLVSIINLGLLIGPIVPAFLTEKLGKKKTLILSATPLLIAHVICAVATTIEVFLLARVLMGLATGATWAVIPVYIGEISEPQNRGLLSSLMAVMGSCGAIFTYCTGPFLSMRWFSILNLIPVSIFLISLFCFVPESPYDLIKENNLKKAEYSLITLRKQSDVHFELSEIKKSIEADNSTAGKFIDLFRNSGLARAMVISMGLLGINALSGICAIIGYAQPIFELAGSFIPSAYSAIIVGCISLLSTIVHSNLVDRLSRKLLITTSCGIMSVAMAALGTFFYLQQNSVNVDSLSWLPLCSLILYMIGYYLGLAAIPYIILGELFPSNLKAVAAGFCTCVNFSLTFIVTLIFPYLFEIIGLAFTFWILATVTTLGFIFCLTVVPETNGKSLQEINIMLNKFNKV